jgi:hypothetical protein
MKERVVKVAISSRIHPDNYAWLKKKSAKLERSANWLLDKLISDARTADGALLKAENERQR